jgi:hypothetical protein
MYSKKITTSGSTKYNITKHPPAKYVSTIFFKFAPAGKNLRNVEFTYVEYYLIR